jgi:hypothetical protein
MPKTPSGSWWSRKFWVIVLLPCLAAVLLAGVAVFKGWLHRWVGFDSEGNPLGGTSAKSRPVVSVTAAYQSIAKDLERRAPEVRPRLRYLTLAHRHNEPACTDADLEAERGAVRELTALLGKGKSGNGDFIDPDQLLFRIDLEDFGWDAGTDWHRLVVHYRYGLGAAGDGPVAKLRRQVEEFTQETIPVVRADWFVVALTQTPLAEKAGLLRMPADKLPEAVRTVGSRYATQTLDLAACARELDLADEKVLADLIRAHDNLQQEFGLAPLLKDERIRRSWWESDRNFFSPYQELARQLKLGKPVREQ